MDESRPVFQDVYVTFHASIVRYLTRLVSESEAEDLAQETFVKVSQALGGFRGEARLKTWIYRIATNVAIDWLRNPARRPGARTESAESPDGPAADDAAGMDFAPGALPEPLSPVEQTVTRGEMNECIRGCIAELRENYRVVLVLGDLEGLTNPEIAGVLGITLDTVKIRLHRARKKLRAMLEARCDAYWLEANEFVPDLRGVTGAARGAGAPQ